VVDVVKLEKDLKAKSEPLLLPNVGKVGEIGLWIQKKNELANLLYVIGNDLKVARLEVDSMNKEKYIYALRWSMLRLCMVCDFHEGRKGEEFPSFVEVR
jgi:hypothetical protein